VLGVQRYQGVRDHGLPDEQGYGVGNRTEPGLR
jgi:hypothetical protein